MSKRPDLTDVTSLTNSSNINAINQNWQQIKEAFDNTLSLDGSTPNTMQGDLDLNGNALLNVDTIDVGGLTLNGQQVTELATVPEWKGSWATTTDYFKNDLVRNSGSSYICLVDHTSGTFSTDLTELKWELFAQQGAAGSGTGDMVGANNLSDIDNAASARNNLGLGTVAVENTVPIAKGGTGATDAATARSNLGVQASDATLTSLSGLSLASGDLLYATASDTLARLAIGTAGRTLVVNSDTTAPEYAGRAVTETGGAAPYFGFRAWGVISDSGVLLASGNVASVSGTSPCAVTFTVAAPNANYAVLLGGFGSSSSTRYPHVRSGTKTTSGFSIGNGDYIGDGIWFAAVW